MSRLDLRVRGARPNANCGQGVGATAGVGSEGREGPVSDPCVGDGPVTGHDMTDWRKIADELADRLACHTGLCRGHPGPRRDCPFCADDDALAAYQAAGGGAGQDGIPQGEWVAIADVKVNTTEGCAQGVDRD